MKINRISFTNDESSLLDRWLERIIEISIIEHLDCSASEHLKLVTHKHLQQNRTQNNQIPKEDII